MSPSDANGDFEKFIESAEGRDWLAWRGWVKVSDVFERALIVPVTSEDIMEDALVMVIEHEVHGIGSGGVPLHEKGIMGRVALVRDEQTAGA